MGFVMSGTPVDTVDWTVDSTARSDDTNSR